MAQGFCTVLYIYHKDSDKQHQLQVYFDMLQQHYSINQMTQGITQESILGPLLFILLINQKYLALAKYKILLNADDNASYNAAIR